MTDFNLTAAEAIFNSQLWSPLLILNIVLGSVAVSCSLIVILVSRRTSLGDGATLIFVRCLCVTDILIGVCAVSKALLLMNIDVLSVDCFLPESLFITAVTASVLFLLWLNLDCFLHLNKPENLRLHIAKGNIISGMVVVWNAAFILGFLPQMGWNAMERVCLFLFYYNHFYLLMVVLLWSLIVLGCYWVQALTSRLTTKIKSSRHFLTTNSKVYFKYGGLTGTVHIQLCSMCACCVPCIGYVVYCFIRYGNPDNFIWVNGYLPYALMIFTFRSVICSFINGYKTSQIRNLMRRVTRSVANSVLRHHFSNYRRRAVRGRRVLRTPNVPQPECWTVQRQINNSIDENNRPCPVCSSDGQRSIDSSTSNSMSTACLHCHRKHCLCNVFASADHALDKDMDGYGRYRILRRNKLENLPFSSSAHQGHHNSGENNKAFDKSVAQDNISSCHPPMPVRKTRSYSEDLTRRHNERFYSTFSIKRSPIANKSPNRVKKNSTPPSTRTNLPSQLKETIGHISVKEVPDTTKENANKFESPNPTDSSQITSRQLRPPLIRNVASCPTTCIPRAPSDPQDLAGAVGLTRRSGTISYFKRWTLRQAMKIRHYSYDGSGDRQKVSSSQDGYSDSFDNSKLILNESGLTEQTAL